MIYTTVPQVQSCIGILTISCHVVKQLTTYSQQVIAWTALPVDVVEEVEADACDSVNTDDC